MQSQFKLKITRGTSFSELERDNMLLFIKDNKSNKEEMKKFTTLYDIHKYIIDFIDEKTRQGYVLESKHEQMITQIRNSLESSKQEDLKYAGMFNNAERALETPEKVIELSLTDPVDNKTFVSITAMHNLKKMKIKLSGDTIPDEIEKLQNIEELIISSVSNNIREVPDGLGGLKKLKKLSLYNGKLKDLPHSLFSLENLKVLILGSNDIQKLHPDIGSLTSLEELDISGNPVDFLPEPIGNCTNLRIVKASYCRFQSIPPDIGRLKRLFSLDLKKNQISELPNELFDCESLEYLYLEHNKLTSIPAGIINLRNLKRLQLTGNNFSPGEIEKLNVIKQKFTEMKKNVKMEFPREIREGNKIVIKNTIQLSPKVIEQLERLDVQYEFIDSMESVYINTASGKHPLPESYRKFLYDVRWEEKLKKKYKIKLDNETEYTNISLGCTGSGSTSEYECSYEHPSVWAGILDGGNYLLLLALDDDHPEDPVVYYIDHEDSHEKMALSSGFTLSGFLSRLE